MKKTMTVLLSVLMILSLTACTNTASSTQQSATGGNAAEENTNMDTVENNTEENISSENEINTNADSVESSTDNAASAENAAPVGTQPEEAEKSDVQGANVLVAYFSATNTTKGVAENLADGLGAELYEIVPETPYTDADLNYNDNNSRTTIEMNDPNARPAISGSVENMEQYEVIFLGYAGGIIGLN